MDVHVRDTKAPQHVELLARLERTQIQVRQDQLGLASHLVPALQQMGGGRGIRQLSVFAFTPSLQRRAEELPTHFQSSIG